MYSNKFALLTMLLWNHAWATPPSEVQLHQCKNAAYHLDLNASLMRDAFEWKAPQVIKAPSNSQEFLIRNNEISKYANAMNNDGSMDRMRLTKWYQAPICQELLSEYQIYVYGKISEDEGNFLRENSKIDKTQLRRVYFYSKSMANQETRDTECIKFSLQRKMLDEINPVTDAFQNRVEAGLRQTLIDSDKQYLRFQKKMLNELTSKELRSLATTIHCQETSGISGKIIKHPLMQSSQRTKSITQASNKLVNDYSCGPYDKPLCEVNIVRKSLNLAYQRSFNCDTEKDSGPQCDSDADSIYKKARREVEIATLTEEKSKRQRYIENPSGSGLFNSVNARGNIELLAEPCMQQAVRSGLKGEAFKDYTNKVCIPPAKAEFIKPQVAELAAIEAQLNKLQASQD